MEYMLLPPCAEPDWGEVGAPGTEGQVAQTGAGPAHGLPGRAGPNHSSSTIRTPSETSADTAEAKKYPGPSRDRPSATSVAVRDSVGHQVRWDRLSQAEGPDRMILRSGPSGPTAAPRGLRQPARDGLSLLLPGGLPFPPQNDFALQRRLGELAPQCPDQERGHPAVVAAGAAVAAVEHE